MAAARSRHQAQALQEVLQGARLPVMRPPNDLRWALPSWPTAFAPAGLDRHGCPLKLQRALARCGRSFLSIGHKCGRALQAEPRYHPIKQVQMVGEPPARSCLVSWEMS